MGSEGRFEPCYSHVEAGSWRLARGWQEKPEPCKTAYGSASRARRRARVPVVVAPGHGERSFLLGEFMLGNAIG